MKHELIKTDNYLLVVDDSEIKEGDFYLRYNNSVLRCTQLKESFNEALNKNEIIILANGCGDPYERSRDYLKKVIAHLPLNNSPILEGVDLLPPLEQEDDVEKLAREYTMATPDNDSVRILSYIKGYNKAKEKYKYTEEDMRKAIQLAWEADSIDGIVDLNIVLHYGDNNDLRTKWSEDEIIQSLSQPKMPIGFECEREFVENKLWGQKGTGIYKNRTTTNSHGQTVWVGKYIY